MRRNFIKSYRSHPEDLKMAVGRRAYQFGADKSLTQMQQGQEHQAPQLTRALVTRFLAHFLRKNPDLPVGPPKNERQCH